MFVLSLLVHDDDDDVCVLGLIHVVTSLHNPSLLMSKLILSLSAHQATTGCQNIGIQFHFH